MSETDSSSRFGIDSISSSTVVTLTGSILGVAGAYITQAWAGGSFLAFGALLGVGVGIPTLYREWDIQLSIGPAFVWAVVASTIGYGFYALVFVLLTRFGVDGGLGDVLAGGATVALGIAFSLYRN
ncbi:MULTISPECIES: hypothetical protein [Halococcus]|uniref:Uncharacterized protein n=1 Tax=Halococcus salifodinae DSM 8989 TaxID=1227456 RepID=M0NBZ4_9EURY|nr:MULTISPECIES: hypothetical protein [Halococcus]EMA55083.1 hypothetical protein C450_03412 [Halococcus salifodinae DSM 8989]